MNLTKSSAARKLCLDILKDDEKAAEVDAVKVDNILSIMSDMSHNSYLATHIGRMFGEEETGLISAKVWDAASAPYTGDGWLPGGLIRKARESCLREAMHDIIQVFLEGAESIRSSILEDSERALGIDWNGDTGFAWLYSAPSFYETHEKHTVANMYIWLLPHVFRNVSIFLGRDAFMFRVWTHVYNIIWTRLYFMTVAEEERHLIKCVSEQDMIRYLRLPKDTESAVFDILCGISNPISNEEIGDTGDHLFCFTQRVKDLLSGEYLP